MKSDIILAGVGGQGILSIAAIIGGAALEKGLYLKQAETHGMSQRGGAVISHLRISSYPIASDLIKKGNADLIIAVEPMESLRYLTFLSKNGWFVTNVAPVKNIPNYPEISKIEEEHKKISRVVALNSDEIASKIGNSKATNMVMLGASSLFFGIEMELIEKNIRRTFEPKGQDIVDGNIKAFKEGQQIAKNIYDKQ